MKLPENPCEGCMELEKPVASCSIKHDLLCRKAVEYQATIKAYKEFGEWVVEWLDNLISKTKSEEALIILYVKEEFKQALTELWKEDGHVTE